MKKKAGTSLDVSAFSAVSILILRTLSTNYLPLKSFRFKLNPFHFLHSSLLIFLSPTQKPAAIGNWCKYLVRIVIFFFNFVKNKITACARDPSIKADIAEPRSPILFLPQW